MRWACQASKREEIMNNQADTTGKTRAKKRGRKSQYARLVEPRLEEVGGWCRDGATDEELAARLGIGARSLYRYKSQFPEFRQALAESKKIADMRVIRSLYERATGYEVYKDVMTKDGKKVRLFQLIPPDVTACIFWLKNRDPEHWRDKQELERGHKGVIHVTTLIPDPDPLPDHLRLTS